MSTHRKELRIIDRLEQTIGLIKCATNEVLSEHPLSKVSFMLKTPDPRVICYIAKDQTKGTIKAARACFFVKLLKEQSQDDIITCFRDVVNNPNVSIHSSCPGTQTSCSDTSSEYFENGYLDNN